VVIGNRPRESFLLSCRVADSLVIHTEKGFSIKESLNKIKNSLRVNDVSSSVVTVKVGRGVPIYKDLLKTLDAALPPAVILEAVGEEGTNRNICTGRRRVLRDIVSFIRIAGRRGNIYPRGRKFKQSY
jgi:hypothetical protein